MTNALLLILIVYICIQIFEHVLTFLNLRNLAKHGDTIPQGFEEHVNQDDLTKMRDYTLAKEKVGFAGSFVDIAITLVFVFGGLLNWYNNWVAALGLSYILTGVLFFLLLTYAGTIIQIPFDLFTTFHIEKKFGFNKQSFGLWCADLVKGLAISTILYGVLLGGAFWLIEALPRYWWFVTWLFFLVFTIFMMYLSPYVIEPLFNKFSPVEDETLEQRIRTTMEKAGLAISKVFMMDASKRSGHSNAYFTGIGHVKRIVLFDTLLESNTPDEIVAILAHEAGHWKKKHILKRLVLMETLALAGTYIAFRIVEQDWVTQLFNINTPNIYVKFLLVGFLGGLVLFPVKPLFSWSSRKHEREADDFAIALTGSGSDLAHSLMKLGKDNLANLHPHPLYAAFYYSHPPIVQRVAYLQAHS
jgi:STE24 endopeptidase